MPAAMTGFPLSVAQACISLAAAQAAVASAIAAAEQMQVRVNVAVVDGSGLPVAFARMTGAPLHSIDIAIDKAYTAASFGFPTARWLDIFRDDEALRLGMPHRPRLVVFGGGLPIVESGADGTLGTGPRIGGIGVSGGSAEQDEACALAGLRAIGLA